MLSRFSCNAIGPVRVLPAAIGPVRVLPAWDQVEALGFPQAPSSGGRRRWQGGGEGCVGESGPEGSLLQNGVSEPVPGFYKYIPLNGLI